MVEANAACRRLVPDADGTAEEDAEETTLTRRAVRACGVPRRVDPLIFELAARARQALSRRGSATRDPDIAGGVLEAQAAGGARVA